MTEGDRWLTAPDGRFGADPLAGRDTLLLSALDQAVVELENARAGHGPLAVRPAVEARTLRHPLSDAVRADLRARLDLGPLPRGGEPTRSTAPETTTTSRPARRSG